MRALGTPALATAVGLFVLYGYNLSAGVGTGHAHMTVSELTSNTQHHSTIDKACSEFSSTPLGTGWSAAECRNVWSSWAHSLGKKGLDSNGQQYREIFKETATELRQRSSPCLVASGHYTDGAGSTTIRHLVTWILAEELGCDWVRKEHPNTRINENGTSLYCHSTIPGVNHDINHGTLKAYPADTPCSLTNWVEYFRYGDHSESMENIDDSHTGAVRNTCIS